LTPLYSGSINIEIVKAAVDAVILFDDEVAFAGQRRLVAQGETVEPAGAAALGLVLAGLLPSRFLEDRSASRPLRVAVVVSGGNPDPAQLESVRAEVKRETSAAASP
jgi:threonine dehydratase